jgi:outer membrane protein OmpA-like peptidoglycan-associated protein
VPTSIGVRVIELTSARFPSGSAEILGPHAAELDRVATVMTALPNVTVLVIGHADQMGSEVANYALSEQRAQQVVSYIVTKGVAASRLSSRAVGEADLLSVGNDATSLALNRRTEFVFYGLIVGV